MLYAPANSVAGVRREVLFIDRKLLISGGGGSFEYSIPTRIGDYIVEFWSEERIIAHDTMQVVSGVTPPPPTGFYDTGKVTPSTIEVDPATYDVMFKLTGYKDKIIMGVVVSEGATKSVSATLESEVTPQTKGYLTVNTSPTGALVMVNGVSCGTSRVTACALSPGPYQLIITKVGSETVERGIGIALGEMDMGTITLTPTTAPPVTKKTVTFKSVPSGASINIVAR